MLCRDLPSLFSFGQLSLENLLKHSVYSSVLNVRHYKNWLISCGYSWCLLQTKCVMYVCVFVCASLLWAWRCDWDNVRNDILRKTLRACVLMLCLGAMLTTRCHCVTGLRNLLIPMPRCALVKPHILCGCWAVESSPVMVLFSLLILPCGERSEARSFVISQLLKTTLVC